MATEAYNKYKVPELATDPHRHEGTETYSTRVIDRRRADLGLLKIMGGGRVLSRESDPERPVVKTNSHNRHEGARVRV